MPSQCNVCKKDREPADLRPYGKDGTPICYECGQLPEHAEEVTRRIMMAFAAVGDSVPVFTVRGPEAIENVPWNEPLVVKILKPVGRE